MGINIRKYNSKLIFFQIESNKSISLLDPIKKLIENNFRLMLGDNFKKIF